MVRRHRLFASLFAAAALLFTQLAVAVHWCDTMARPEPVQVMAHHEGCPGMAAAVETNVNLCHAHCQYGNASVDTSPAPAADLAPAGPALFIAPVALPAIESDAPPSWRLAPAAAPPPPSILFGVLRI